MIPPETGDGLDEKDGAKTSAREDEKMPPGSIQIQEGGKTEERPGTETGDARSGNPAEETTSEVSRLKRATKRVFGFLSVDQEMRLREASTGARDPEGIVFRADCQAGKLCQGILTMDPMLIIVAIEISIQNLMKEIRKTIELEKATAGKSSINPIDSDKSSPPPPCSSGPEDRLISTEESSFPNKESKSTKEPRANEPVSNEERARKEAEENHTFLSPHQEARVKKAASGFTNATEMLIRNANNEARLLCQEGSHMKSALASTAIEEIMRTLVDTLIRCKDRNEMDEQIRIEEVWIENEVERKIREKRFEDEVSKRVMEERGQQSKHREEEIREIGRAAQRGWGFLNPDQVKHVSRAAVSALQEPRTSQHRIDSRARRLCRENFLHEFKCAPSPRR